MPPPALTLGGFGAGGDVPEAVGAALGDGLFVSRACLRALNEADFAGGVAIDRETGEDRTRVETGFMRSSEGEAAALTEDVEVVEEIDVPSSDASTILMGTRLRFGAMAAEVADDC